MTQTCILAWRVCGFKKGVGESLTPTSAQRGDSSSVEQHVIGPPFPSRSSGSARSSLARYNAPIVPPPNGLQAHIQVTWSPPTESQVTGRGKKNNNNGHDCFSRAATWQPVYLIRSPILLHFRSGARIWWDLTLATRNRGAEKWRPVNMLIMAGWTVMEDDVE